MKFSRASVLVSALVAALSGAVHAYNDTDVLVFALNLECLEAEFYSWAAYGKGLNATLLGNGPISTGGQLANLTGSNYSSVAMQIANDEINHVAFLRAALGPSAPPCPQMNIGTAFSDAADAALGQPLSPRFSPYTDYVTFLHGALLFEDVGVMAYNGAIGALQTPAYQAAARSIMAVEAYHAAIIRQDLAALYNTIVPAYPGVRVSAVVTAIGTTLDALLGLNRTQPVGSLYNKPNITPANQTTGLAYAVTPAQVLNVVYLSASPNVTTGGFFPNGIQGLLNSTRGVLDTQMPMVVAPSPIFNWTDVDVLNFALNLECLEAEFYSWAAFGEGLNDTLLGGGPASTGGKQANLTVYQAVAEEIATEEIQHVAFLRAALGDDAVPCPQMNLSAFSAAANAALNMTLAPAFAPWGDYILFLHGALLFEDVGVMAYNGAIGALNNSDYKAAARAIMAVEAYHAGAIRNALANVTSVVVPAYNVSVSAIVAAIDTTIDALLALPRNQPIMSYNSTNPHLVPVNSQGLAYSITPRQTLNVVYLAPNATMGGFFPMGIEGKFGEDAGNTPGLTNVTSSGPSSSTPPAGSGGSTATGTTARSPASKLTQSVAAACGMLAVVLGFMA